MRKILIGLIVVFLFGMLIFTARAAQQENASVDKSNRKQILSYQIRDLRHNIRVIIRDKHFDYPDRFRSLKGLWRQIADWIGKTKLTKRKIDDRFWPKIFRGLGLASLIALPFLLVYFIPEMFVHSGALKRSGEIDHQKSTGKFAHDLKYQAQVLAEKGQLKEAVRLLYLTGLEFLQRNRILPDSSLRLSDKTNLQIACRLFGPNHPGYRAFSELVLVFQEKWFGLRNCQIEDYHRLIEDLKIIESTMGNPHVEK